MKRGSQAGTSRQRRTTSSARLGGIARVWALNVTMMAGAVVLAALVVARTPGAATGVRIPWWILTASFCLAEIFVVHLHFRRDAHSFSLSEVALVLGLFFSSPLQLVLAQALGSALALSIHRKQPPIKLFFNMAHFAIETGLATIVFRLIAGSTGSLGPAAWAGAFVATLVSSMLGVAAVFVAISLTQRSLRVDRLPQTFGMAAIVSFTNTSLALIGVMVISRDSMAGWLLLVPTATVFFAYRAYTSHRQRHESLQFLYETSRIINRTAEVETAMVSLLDHARDMFRAEVAELSIVPAALAEGMLRTRRGPGADVEIMRDLEERPMSGVWHEAVSEGRAILLSRPVGDPNVSSHFAPHPIRDAMIVPLRGEKRIVGAMAVANRLSDVSTFDAEDLKLFETLANHVAMWLESDRLEQSLEEVTKLKDQLSFQAFHDPLTGLANRALLMDRVEHALTQSEREGTETSVLFVDLDDFKTINDSLGHAAGDRLLLETAQRLEQCARPGDTVARFGGDEFGILLEETGVEGASALAERILAALDDSFTLGGREVFVHASIGISVGVFGIAAGDLLRDADAAMYMAKAAGKGRYEIFRDSMHADLVDRLGMQADLRRALERGQLSVRYQPIVDFSEGRITAVEALVRWNHPRRGFVPPAQFIPLAEENGLIIHIGRWVLGEACRQAAVWRARYGADAPAVSVNLSAKQIQHPNLVEDIVSALETSGLDPRHLILEITENVMLEDTEGAIRQLQSLRRLGVSVAIDDFGTGYSSLSQLRQLPVNYLKIDKAFVNGLGKEPEDAMFMRAIIGLADTLHVKTVAEGIENDEQLAELRRLGCNFGQGYLLAHPLARGQMESLLRKGHDAAVAERAHLSVVAATA